MQNKKGIQLGQAFGAVLSVILIAVLIIVAIYLFTNLSTSMLTKNTAGTVANETVTTPLGVASTLASASLIDGSCGTITSVLNGTTGNVAIALGNFTQTGCSIINTSSMADYGTSIRVSYPYTYSASTASSNASDSMITQFATYPTLIGLVGTIIFLGIVIGVLVGSFLFGGRKGV
jgi:hypothetical protein